MYELGNRTGSVLSMDDQVIAIPGMIMITFDYFGARNAGVALYSSEWGTRKNYPRS